jgi:uncharacterized damage-inducible protein DinB
MPGTVPPVADEREALIGYLRQQRDAVRISAYGLTDEQAGQAPSTSSLTIGGLIKHLAQVERNWISMITQQPRAGGVEDYLEGFTFGSDDTLAAVLKDYDGAAADTEAVIAGVADLGEPVPVPKDSPWLSSDVDAWSVRWVLLHLIEETAKHSGHADIVRESIDGATFHPLMAAVEGWPESPWLKPWKPEVMDS